MDVRAEHRARGSFEEYVRIMEVRVLGPVEVLLEGNPVSLGGIKQRALLALLVANVPEVVSVDRLIDGIWGEEASPGARSTLQTYASNLRQILGDVIRHDRGGYRLDIPSEAVDAVRFGQALEQARKGVLTEPDRVATGLRRVLGLWRGLPYSDLDLVPGLEGEIRRLGEARLEAVELRIDAELASGHHTDLIAELEALAEEHPTRERFRAQHMLALYRAGRQADALRAYRRTERFLADELGVDPSPELQELELKILEHDASLLIGQARAITQRLAFMVTDIEGSTRLWDRFPQAMAGALAIHDRFLEEAIESSGGRIFKRTGDGVLAVFGDAESAVAAAERAQRALTAHDWVEVDPLRVRVGIDVGEAEGRDNDFFGPPLNRAARLCAIAHGGQVLVSSSVQEEVAASAPAGLQVRHLGEVHLRGMATPERVAQMVFVGLPADFPPPRSDTGGILDERMVLALPGYEIREQIGAGAFGVVWRAYQPSVGREVAVKVIRPELASQPSFVRRFEAEARTVARLAHPHIVPLIDFWRDEDGAYLVLGLLPGGSLERVMASGMVETSAARRILSQVGAALDHAHSQRLAHGDLKPANVLLDGSGNAYLSDFGIPARLVDSDTISSIESAPAYRAPELLDTGPTPEADLFALGMLARQLLDGAATLEPILARATAANPDDRYHSAASLIADLDLALGDVDTEVAPAVVSRNPFKGLRPFDEADFADFFGRDDLVSALITAVERHRFVAVVGPSGSGKSSVVRAGLLTALREGRIPGLADSFHAVFTPGPRPVESMVTALERVLPVRSQQPSDGFNAWLLGALGGTGLVLVIDQFEELYTQADEPDRRAGFIDLLVGLVAAGELPVRVVITLRADFYDRPLADSRLGPLVRNGQVTVLPPTREELVQMITGPSQAVGLRWEPGLPYRITEDVTHQSGVLPLLQYALTEMVERRTSDFLDGSDYERVGEVTGALARRAEAVYQSFEPARQEAARQILLRLVTVDEESDDTRRRVRRSELESLGIERQHLDAVLDLLISERLLLADRDPVTRGPTIEVAHEALLREWPRLATWIDEQREGLILGRRFRSALDEWEASGGDEDYLLTGSRLAPFTGWAETVALTEDERSFYEASRERDEAERLSRRRRRRALTAILAGATVVASVLGLVASMQATEATRHAERADDQARLAEENAAEAERQAESARANESAAEAAANLARARELMAAAQTVVESDPVLAKLLGLAALEHANDEVPFDLRSALRRAMAIDRTVHEYHWVTAPPRTLMSADIHPTLPRIVVGGQWQPPASRLHVYDYQAERVVWSFGVPDSRVVLNEPAFSADGSLVAVGAEAMPDLVRADELPLSSGPWLHDDAPLANPVHVPATEPELLGAFLFDADTGDLIRRIPLHDRCGGFVYGVAANRMLVAYLADPAAGCSGLRQQQVFRFEIIDLTSGERQLLTESVLNNAVLSNDGSRVAFVESDEAARLTVVLDLETGERLVELDPFQHHGLTQGYPHAISEDGSFLILGDRPMGVLEVDTGRILATFSGHRGEAVPVFAPDGETVFSIGREGHLRRWLTLRGTEISLFPSVGTLGSISVGQGDRVLVVDQTGRVARVIDTGPHLSDTISTCGGFVVASTLAVSGDRAVLQEVCPDGSFVAELVDLEEGAVTGTIAALSQTITVSPDGTHRAVVHLSGDAPAGTEADGGQWMGPMGIVDITTGELTVELEGTCTWDFFSDHPVDCVNLPDTPFQVWAVRAAWSPDGNLLAVVGHGGVSRDSLHVVVWNTWTGEMVATVQPCSVDVPVGAIFSPNGRELLVTCFTGEMVAVSTFWWEPIPSRLFDLSPFVQGWNAVAPIGFTPDGTTLVAVGGDFSGGVGELIWIVPSRLAISGDPIRAFDGAPKSYAISPNRRLVAIGDSAGFAKVFDITSRELVDEFVLDGQVQGLGFIDDETVIAAPEGGDLYRFSLDPAILVRQVQDSLSREFTTLECWRYGFTDRCPTMEELKRVSLQTD